MKKELDELLCKRYPEIFAERQLPMSETAMCWGFSCGDGWFDLIETLCCQLQKWTDQEGGQQVVASQVKEKFGELCFYPRSSISPEQWAMISLAEVMSTRICDQCGSPGQTLILKHWHMTRCADHSPPGAQIKERQ